MNPADIIDESDACRCSSADDLMNKLDPRHDLWAKAPSAWIFRGHADASWKLLASAHRPGELKKVLPDAPIVPVALSGRGPSLMGDDSELRLIKRFRRALDAYGLPVPVVAPPEEHPGVKGTYPGEVDRDAWPTRALARHYGLPTGLLDWSRRARVAAYFAAAEAAEKDTSGNPKLFGGSLQIWALRADFLKEQEFYGSDDGFLEIFTAPGAGNPNLQAQSGLFTIQRGGSAPVPVDEFLLRFVAEHSARLTAMSKPIMRCLSLAQSHAPTLLRLLSYEGVTGASMFPGYDGVARSLREKVLWDEYPKEED